MKEVSSSADFASRACGSRLNSASEDSRLTILHGDALDKLRELPDESVQCCVTSPPFYGLRDYGTAKWEGGDDTCVHDEYQRRRNANSQPGTGNAGMVLRDGVPPMDCKCGAKRIDSQLGLEKTPEEYVARMVEIFREVRRVLRNDGTLWLNLGDSYNGVGRGEKANGLQVAARATATAQRTVLGLKGKDLCGIPWRVAFALQADGWYLRQDIIWAKPNPMPESVTDRCTKAHEYLFLLTKSARYFYDAEAIKEKFSDTSHPTGPNGSFGGQDSTKLNQDRNDDGKTTGMNGSGRNKRSVWTVATAPYPEAHFATYPPDLIKPCILAGTSAKGCCPACAGPWERIVERREAREVAPSELDRFGNGEAGVHRKVGGQYQKWMDENPTKTLGWQPTCECGDFVSDAGDDFVRMEVYKPIPCAVLDPFAGSGTTGAVALELGRRAILIELNENYIELINSRCTITLGFAFA